MNTIKCIIMDVDGTLTSGFITYGDSGESKTFNIKDGLIIQALKKLDITVIFLTGRRSLAVERRAVDLGVIPVQGIADKKSELRKLLTEHRFSFEETAYIGDDLNDYAAMKLCGFIACPSDAVFDIKAICDYISPFPGGFGAVRDICEHILRKQGQYKDFLELYISS